MAYNLYQVQMAQAWKERCDKENTLQEKAALENALARSGMDMEGSVASFRTGASRSSKRSYTTNILKSRLEDLETALNEERTLRLQVESELRAYKDSQNAQSAMPKPRTPLPSRGATPMSGPPRTPSVLRDPQ